MFFFDTPPGISYNGMMICAGLALLLMFASEALGKKRKKIKEDKRRKQMNRNEWREKPKNSPLTILLAVLAVLMISLFGIFGLILVAFGWGMYQLVKKESGKSKSSSGSSYTPPRSYTPPKPRTPSQPVGQSRTFTMPSSGSSAQRGARTFNSTAADHQHITVSGPTAKRRLDQLKIMREAGLIDDAEYREKVQQIH